jgi:hypothetical protein
LMSNIEEGSIKAFSPRLLWYNGKTYWSYQSYWQASPGGQARMLVYDEGLGFDRPYIVGEVTPNDAHTVPMIAIDNAGRIHITQEHGHITALDYYRADNVEDYGAFTVQTDIGSDVAYAQGIKKQDGNYVIYHRSTQSTESKTVSVLTSASGFDGPWTGPTRIVDNTAGSSSDRLYAGKLLNFYFGGEYYLLATRRVETGAGPDDIAWHQFYLLVTADFNTYRNYENTFSKSVSGSGTVTMSEMDTYFKYWETDDTVTQGYMPVAALSPLGNFYSVVANGDNNYYLVYYDGGWQSQAITIPDLVAIEDLRGGVGNDGGIEYILPFNDLDIIIIGYIDEGTYVKPHFFRSNDRGVTWTDLGDMLNTVNDNIWGVMLPNNVMDIPQDRNFPIYFTADDSVAAGIDVNKVYFTRACFGSIQSESGSISAASDMTHASGLFHYKAVSADMTLSGTNVLSLVDKFGLRNATAVNNPVWNSVDMVTLNGTTNYFNIATTGLTGLTTFTYMVVAQTVLNQAGMALSFSVSTVTNKFLNLFANHSSLNSGFWQYNNNAISNFSYGTDLIGDSGVHLIAFVCDGRSKVDIYIDGKLQYYNPTTYTDYGKGPAAIATIDRVRIGMMDRSASDVYTALKFKEMVLYSAALDLTTLRGKMKKLCNDYGITYQDQFQ